MMHVQLLCQMPPVQKGDASSLCQLINHVSSHMNALQALSLNVPIQDLILNHLNLILRRSRMGTVWLHTSATHRLPCGHLNTRSTEHAETWNHCLTHYFHII